MMNIDICHYLLQNSNLLELTFLNLLDDHLLGILVLKLNSFLVVLLIFLLKELVLIKRMLYLLFYQLFFLLHLLKVFLFGLFQIQICFLLFLHPDVLFLLTILITYKYRIIQFLSLFL